MNDTTLATRAAWRLVPAVPVLVTVLFASGCATTLSTLVDPETTPPKKVHVDVGKGIYIPVSSVVRVIDQGIREGTRLKEMAQSGEHPTLSDDDKRSLLEAGLALALMPPSTAFEVQVRTGIVNDMDLGLRYSSNQLRLDGRWRLFHAETWAAPEPSDLLAAAGEPLPFGRRVLNAIKPDRRLRSYDATLQIGVARYLFNNPVFEVLDYVHLGDFSRWDFDAALTWGVDVRRIFKFYLGPKLVLSRFSLDETLYEVSAVAGELANVTLVESQDHWMW